MSEDTNVVESEEVVENVAEGTEEVAKPKAPVVVKIIRGRMPLPLVWHVRFVASKTSEDTIDDETSEVIPGGYTSDSAVAKDMFTTAGKIMDIRTNRNFKYLTEGSTFSQSDIDEAKAMLTKNIAEGKKRGADEASHDYTEDEAKSLFDILDTMVAEKSTIADDRSAFNEANPRAVKAKVEAVESETDGEDVDGSPETVDEESNAVDEEIEDLMS